MQANEVIEGKGDRIGSSVPPIRRALDERRPAASEVCWLQADKVIGLGASRIRAFGELLDSQELGHWASILWANAQGGGSSRLLNAGKRSDRVRAISTAPRQNGQ